MGTSIAFYVRKLGDSIPSAIHQDFPAARLDVGSDFISVTFDDNVFEPPAERLANLSSALNTDVIWLSFQSTVDAFEFHHWHEGKTLRSLIFGCYQEERTWERAEGDPEPWEREAFFSEKALSFELKHADAEKKQELQRIWSEAELLPGKTDPNIDGRDAAWKVAHARRTRRHQTLANIDGRDAAWKVAEYYHFPGWG